MITEIEELIMSLGNHPGLCFYYTKYIIDILKRYGYNAVPQAGSMQWRRLKEDDGVCATHFSYMWNPATPISTISMALGQLPEMHCWVGLIDEQEVVDFSTRHLKSAAAAIGMEWTAEDPPQYLWCAVGDIPESAYYIPNREATIYAGLLMEQFKNRL